MAGTEEYLDIDPLWHRKREDGLARMALVSSARDRVRVGGFVQMPDGVCGTVHGKFEHHFVIRPRKPGKMHSYRYDELWRQGGRGAWEAG